MSEFKGTSGPWVHHEPSGYQHSMGGYILGGEGKICDVSGFGVGSDAAKENAKLIAAAPELLEVLQETVEALKRAWNTGALPHDIILEDLAHRQIKVIAKALGQ